MKNKHILDLTLRLSQALDQNYDVVSMDTVLSVISALESTTITKEQLEATRLAKYINQLRRRTNCENLARRAKSLLKRWREMVGIQQLQQHTNDCSVSIATSNMSTRPVPSTIAFSTATTSFNIPATEYAFSTSHISNPQLNYQHFVDQQLFSQSTLKQNQSLPYSQEMSTLNETLISVSNPVPVANLSKSANFNAPKKTKLEKTSEDQQLNINQQQPTSFANLLTGLGDNKLLSSFSAVQKTSVEQFDNFATKMRPVETYVIEHSSNSNSDIICLPSNTVTSATDVPPIVIDLQDTNSSMTSIVSKDASFSASKQTSKKPKKEKKRKERDSVIRQTQSLQDCDDNNASTISYHHKGPPDTLLVNEKSHSVCPTMSNISEILSLSNSSVFPSVGGKSVYELGQTELPSSSEKIKKSDLTFTGKFNQIKSSSSAGCEILNCNNIKMLSETSTNQNKLSVFGGSGTTNSNDSTSNSRISHVNSATDAIRHEENSTTDNVVSVAAVCTTAAPHQQSLDFTTIDFSSEQTKQPKKKGRKKGSKGVDSVIAKETSLSSQMLISTFSAAGKKVKTTKELYAEMENRKLHNVKTAIIGGETLSSSSTTWTSQQLKTINSRHTSYYSDIAESDSCTMTSEPSRDSGRISINAVGKREMPSDNNSNYSQHRSDIKNNDICGEGTTTTQNTPNSSTLAITLKLKHDLQEIFKHLPPPPCVEEIERDCLNNVTPCTCVVEEIVASEAPYIIDSCREQIFNSSFRASNNVLNFDKKEFETEQNINITDANFSSEVQPNFVDQSHPPNMPKKSIFDLDFDDEEDPLNSIIADIVGKSTKESDAELIKKLETSSSTTENYFPSSNTDESIFGNNNHDKDNSSNIDVNHQSPLLNVYKIKYDPECEAKYRFGIQTQKITKFHVDTLHNCFIPNVNGNWNHADDSITKKREIIDNNLRADFTDGYGVVPIYSSEINDKIVKDLSQENFTTKFKHRSWKSQKDILFHIPFIGVSRLAEISKVKSNKSQCLNEEEKENFENKLNLAKMRSHGSEPTVNLFSANENAESKDIKKKTTKRKNTRFKKSATSTKCSKIKRLKSPVKSFNSIEVFKFRNNDDILKENVEISTTDSDFEIDEHSAESEVFVESLNNKELQKIEAGMYHHEVVCHDVSDKSNNENHVALAIKKPAKTNSPLNTSSYLSPVYFNIQENLSSISNKENGKTSSCKKQNPEVYVTGSKKDYAFLRLDQIKSHKSSESYKKIKLHNSLFHHEEIFPLINQGTQLYRESIFHISSCSSSCSTDEETIMKTPPLNLGGRHIRSASLSSNSPFEKNSVHKNDGLTYNLQQDFILSEFKKQTSTTNAKSTPNRLEIRLDSQLPEQNNDSFLVHDDDNLPAENNLMLVSFNHICLTRDGKITHLNSEQLNKHRNERENLLLNQQHQNCDDSNLNNNFNLLKYIDNKNFVSSNINNNNINSSIINYLDSSITLSGKCKHLINKDDAGNKNITFEGNQSGIRIVDEDVNNEQGINCELLKEFKEWHEVLQLRSYNDELLTVLPYVVMD